MNFKTHLIQFLDQKEVESLLDSLQLPNQTAFRINTLKVKNVNELFDNFLFSFHPYVKDGYYYNKEISSLGKSILFEAGAYYIQEPSAMMAVELLNPRAGDKVLDMCAAPGGKSFHAINLMQDKGLLISNDIHPIRAQILSSNMEKCGCKQIIVLQDDSKKYKQKFLSFFDKIILDAPCSGSGMFRKNEFAITDWSMEKVLQCQKMQLSLLEDAYEMLNREGILLYSTCSFSKEENEDVIQIFLKEHSDCNLIKIPLKEDFLPSIGIEGAIRLHPNHYKGEGHFIALIQKRGVKNNLQKKEQLKMKKNIHPAVIQFLNDFQFSYDKNKIVNWDDHYYYADFDIPSLERIKFLRYGLSLGEIKNNRFIPNHAFAMYHQHSNHCIALTKEQAQKYIAGECIQYLKEGKGYQIVTYKNLPLGWVKQVGYQLKNHYPKGLRKKIENIDD